MKCVMEERRMQSCGKKWGWKQMKGCEAASPWRRRLQRRWAMTTGVPFSPSLMMVPWGWEGGGGGVKTNKRTGRTQLYLLFFFFFAPWVSVTASHLNVIPSQKVLKPSSVCKYLSLAVGWVTGPWADIEAPNQQSWRNTEDHKCTEKQPHETEFISPVGCVCMLLNICACVFCAIATQAAGEAISLSSYSFDWHLGKQQHCSNWLLWVGIIMRRGRGCGCWYTLSSTIINSN